MRTMNSASLDSILQVLKWILNTIFHQCVAVLAIYAIWVPIENYSNPFSWHVILCTLGILPLMAEGLMLFSTNNVWSQEVDRKQKFWIHGGFMVFGISLVLTGISVEISRRSQFNMGHFISAHSITGLICMIILIISLICGPMALFSTCFMKWLSPQWIKLIHNITGQFAYIMGIISLCLGYYIGWFITYTSETSRASATILTVIVALWSLIGAWKSSVHQIKSILAKD